VITGQAGLGKSRLLPLVFTGQAGPSKSKLIPQAPEDYEVAADVDAILKRLDQGIATEHAAMDRLLERIVSRTPR
jgi:hypothetical protein